MLILPFLSVRDVPAGADHAAEGPSDHARHFGTFGQDQGRVRADAEEQGDRNGLMIEPDTNDSLKYSACHHVLS